MTTTPRPTMTFAAAIIMALMGCTMGDGDVLDLRPDFPDAPEGGIEIRPLGQGKELTF